ncbi:MAG: ATP-binding protein [Candidatus Algichlamydia australiensis]|nr:ATP-binding protein [Chlamydiales bacterium]
MKPRIQRRLIRTLSVLTVGFVGLMAVVLNAFVIHAAKVRRFATEAYPLFAQNFEWSFAYIAIFSFFTLSIVTGIVLWRNLQPLRKIVSALNHEEGYIEDEKILTRSDEFGFLAQKINAMAGKASDEQYFLGECHKERKALIEGLEEGVILFNGNLQAVVTNRSAQKILKVPKKDLIGKGFHELTDCLPAALWKQIQRMLSRSQETQSVLSEVAVTNEHVILRVCPVPGASGVVLTLRDDAVEHQVSEMGRDFIANASHELRTPITIIRGFAETLRDIDEISSDMLEGILEKIIRNCNRMNHLVANLLTLADLDSENAGALQETDIVSLVDDCNRNLLLIHPETFIEILHNKEQIEIPLNGDLFGLALTNLLQNAVKYSEGNASIRVTVEDRENEVVIKIADKGIGIPPQDLPHVFDRFYTVDKAHSRSMGGAGLGLSIVRRIVEKHRGTIHVSSVHNQGTTFTILIPKELSGTSAATC